MRNARTLVVATSIALAACGEGPKTDGAATAPDTAERSAAPAPPPVATAPPAAPSPELAGRASAARQRIREQPTSGQAHHALALVYFEMGEDAAGKAALFRAMALAPSDPAIVQAIADFTPRMAPFSVDEADAARARLEAADAAGAPPTRATPPTRDALGVPDPDVIAAESRRVAAVLEGGAPPPDDDDAPTTPGGGDLRAVTDLVEPAAAVDRAGGPAAGRYKCYASINGATQYVFIDFDITGPDTYRDKQGTSGRFSLDGKTIEFAGGSLAGYNARLLGPRKIGIAEKPRTFFNTVCDRK